MQTSQHVGHTVATVGLKNRLRAFRESFFAKSLPKAPTGMCQVGELHIGNALRFDNRYHKYPSLLGFMAGVAPEASNPVYRAMVCA